MREEKKTTEEREGEWVVYFQRKVKEMRIKVYDTHRACDTSGKMQTTRLSSHLIISTNPFPLNRFAMHERSKSKSEGD